MGDQISTLLFRVDLLRDTVRRRMYDLQRDYNTTFESARLRLRPWSRGKKRPPYALYWIEFPPAKLVVNHNSMSVTRLEPRWPFHRLAIRTNRALDSTAYRCQLAFRRREIFDFHRRAQDLNGACRITTRALDTTRKLLSTRAADHDPDDDSHLRGRTYYDDFDREMAWLLTRLRDLRKSIGRDVDALVALVDEYEANPWCSDLGVVFDQDSGLPFGQLLWIDLRTGGLFTNLSEYTQFKLRLEPHEREMATRVEAKRRAPARRLARSTKTLLRIRGLLSGAAETGQVLLDQARVSPSLEEVMSEDRGPIGGPKPWESPQPRDDSWEFL